MKKLITLFSAGIFALAIMFFLPGISPADAASFMKLDDIKGESKDKGHEDWIEILSMSPSLSGLAEAAGGRQKTPLVITKAVDKASPMLQRASTSGQRFPTVIIEVAEYGGSRATYLKYELKNVRITSYSVDQSGASGDRPVESISLYYNKIKFEYDKKPSRKKDKKDR